MPESSHPGSLLGSVLGGAYQVDRVLDEGAMATVYEALHFRFGNRVAVKVIARPVAPDAAALARFRRAAEITSALGHPHIAQALDFGTTTDGRPFLVMELLEGEDLQRRLRRVGKLPLSSTVSIVHQLARALAAAHRRGVVHGALEPRNVFLLDVAGETDVVKLLGFGVSSLQQETSTGEPRWMVTPQYLAPEQVQGLAEPPDPRTDQWALACLAWELLSGRPPFAADEPALLHQVVHETPPPLITQESRVQLMVDRVLRRALAKHKEHRFPDITGFSLAFALAVSPPGAGQLARSSTSTVD